MPGAIFRSSDRFFGQLFRLSQTVLERSSELESLCGGAQSRVEEESCARIGLVPIFLSFEVCKPQIL